MFKSLKNIQGAFALTRIFLILITVASVFISCFAILSSFQFAEAQREKIYVLDGEKSLIMALSQDVNQNRIAEAKSHVKRFHEYFFTISPNKESILYNIHQALPLADNSATDQYQRMIEEGFYDQVVAASIVMEIRIDSIIVDDTAYPFKVYTYATQSISRSSNITFRTLQTECNLLNCSRSDSNPHGMLIEKWKIMDNKNIRTIERK